MDGRVVGQLALGGVEVGIAAQGHGAAEDDSLGDHFVLTPSPPAFAGAGPNPLPEEERIWQTIS